MYLVLLLFVSLFALSTGHSPPQQPLNPSQSHSTGKNDELFSLHKSLIQIDSVSGNEHNVGEFLITYLKTQNYTVETQSLPPLPRTKPSSTRHNIFAYPGTHRQTKILLTSHIDTVPPFINYSAHHDSSTHKATEIWGRGSNDAKGSVAAQIIALNDLLSSNTVDPSDVSLLFVVGEEVTGDGMRAANDLGLAWKAVIFGEPTELNLANGHKGMSFFEVKAKGKAAHSGYPWLGESAVEMIIPALVALKGLKLPGSERYGNTTINLGVLEGGQAKNVVPAHAALQASVRLGGGTPDEVRSTIEKVVKDANPKLEVDFGDAKGYPPVECDTDIEGFGVQTMNYGTDVPNLKGSHKRYLYGPGSIVSAHSDNEMVKAGDLVKAVEGYKKLVMGALKKSK
ncbi:MAG: hypothetical protein LQ340_002261 [Diploschistes diacapsis]|nr:MAG: hypothetical protein LQ340_002261 [Diploschistes diacapsis]